MAKRDKLKVKSILPKEENIPKASGEIVLRKDTNLDILCFDRNIDVFYLVSVRLRPQNHPIAPITPEVSLLSSSDSGYNCQ